MGPPGNGPPSAQSEAAPGRIPLPPAAELQGDLFMKEILTQLL